MALEVLYPESYAPFPMHLSLKFQSNRTTNTEVIQINVYRRIIKEIAVQNYRAKGSNLLQSKLLVLG